MLINEQTIIKYKQGLEMLKTPFSVHVRGNVMQHCSNSKPYWVLYMHHL